MSLCKYLLNLPPKPPKHLFLLLQFLGRLAVAVVGGTERVFGTEMELHFLVFHILWRRCRFLCGVGGRLLLLVLIPLSILFSPQLAHTLQVVCFGCELGVALLENERTLIAGTLGTAVRIGVLVRVGLVTITRSSGAWVPEHRFRIDMHLIKLVVLLPPPGIREHLVGFLNEQKLLLPCGIEIGMELLGEAQECVPDGLVAAVLGHTEN